MPPATCVGVCGMDVTPGPVYPRWLLHAWVDLRPVHSFFFVRWGRAACLPVKGSPNVGRQVGWGLSCTHTGLSVACCVGCLAFSCWTETRHETPLLQHRHSGIATRQRHRHGVRPSGAPGLVLQARSIPSCTPQRQQAVSTQPDHARGGSSCRPAARPAVRPRGGGAGRRPCVAAAARGGPHPSSNSSTGPAHLRCALRSATQGLHGLHPHMLSSHHRRGFVGRTACRSTAGEGYPNPRCHAAAQPSGTALHGCGRSGRRPWCTGSAPGLTRWPGHVLMHGTACCGWGGSSSWQRSRSRAPTRLNGPGRCCHVALRALETPPPPTTTTTGQETPPGPWGHGRAAGRCGKVPGRLSVVDRMQPVQNPCLNCAVLAPLQGGMLSHAHRPVLRPAGVWLWPAYQQRWRTQAQCD